MTHVELIEVIRDDYIKDEVSLSTDEKLDSFIKIITEEKDKRKRIKNQKLMDAFKKAWYDLKEAGIDVSFIDKDYHEHYFISCFEDIEFH